MVKRIDRGRAVWAVRECTLNKMATTDKAVMERLTCRSSPVGTWRAWMLGRRMTARVGHGKNLFSWNYITKWCTVYFLCIFIQTTDCMPPIAISEHEGRTASRDFSLRGLDIFTGPARPEEQDNVPDEEDLTTRQLLNSFGLKSIPTEVPDDPIAFTPSFMLNLYEELSQTGSIGGHRAGSLFANTVRSFYETETDRGRRNIYEFDITGVLPRETVVAAELRLFKMAPRSEKLSQIDNTTLPSVIQVLQWPDVINSTEGDKDLLDQRFVDIQYSGLVTFDVTSAFEDFVAREGDQLQKAFRVKVRDFFEEKFHTKKIVKFAKDPKHEDRRPLLVLFLHDSAIPISDIEVPSTIGQAGHHSRRRREVNLSKEELRKRVKRRLGGVPSGVPDVSTEERRRRQPKSKKRRTKSKGTCRLYDYTVDFQKVGWGTWIIAPGGYDANFCDGYCPFPLDAPFNATNHATVQAILHEKGIKRRGTPLPSPCCVPQDFNSIHVLYLDDNNVVLKEFDNMMATSCACH